MRTPELQIPRFARDDKEMRMTRIRQSAGDLSFNDCGALSAIAFVGGSAVYLYIGLRSAAVSAAVVRASRPTRARAGCPRDSRQDAGATKIDAC